MHTQNHGAIAQLVEQRTENPCVPGSIPGGTTAKTANAVFFYSNWFSLLSIITLNASFISSGKNDWAINSNHLSLAFANLAKMLFITFSSNRFLRHAKIQQPVSSLIGFIHWHDAHFAAKKIQYQVYLIKA